MCALPRENIKPIKDVYLISHFACKANNGINERYLVCHFIAEQAAIFLDGAPSHSFLLGCTVRAVDNDSFLLVKPDHNLQATYRIMLISQVQVCFLERHPKSLLLACVNEQEQFSRCGQTFRYRKLLFSLAWFHAILLERRKFKSLGFNVPYEFNESDFSICHDLVIVFLDEVSDSLQSRSSNECTTAVVHSRRNLMCLRILSLLSLPMVIRILPLLVRSTVVMRRTS